MRKLYFAILAAVAMFATSCQQEVDLGVNGGDVATISVEVGTPQMRSFSDGEQASVLKYAVYDVNGSELFRKEDASIIGGRTTVKLDLATNRTYTIYFWAQAENAPYTFNGNSIEVDYTNAVCNDEDRDAFYGVIKNHEVRGAATVNVELKRPFAQVNVGASDFAEAAQSGLVPSTSALVVKNVFTTLNLFDGTASDNTDATFAAAAIPSGEDFPYNKAEYKYLAMSYVLVGKDAGSYDVTYTINAVSGNPVERTIGMVPMRSNYRTNIYGKLLTNGLDVNIDVNPDYNEPDNNEQLWDGTTLKEPALDEATKTYSITHASELAWIAQLVNGTLDTDNVSRAAVAVNDLKGYTVKLMDDINLNKMEWTPIGHSSNHFRGTFDGNGKTISGLKVTQRRDTRAALFGTVSGTVEFKNLTISGAEVRCPDFKGDFYGSALIGTAYGYVTIENVDVVDSYISGNNKVGALIAHDGVMNTLTVSDCDVLRTTFEAADAKDCGSVGGLLGYFQTGNENHITNCSVKGCTFNVANSTNSGKRANGLLIGGIDSKASQKLYIDECVVENNTWNEKFYVNGVEVTEGKFVSPFGGLIGGERDDKAEGKLYINGVKQVTASTQEELNAAIADNTSITLTEGTYVLPSSIQGKTVTIAGSGDAANTVINTQPVGSYGDQTLSGATVVFENISITTDNSSWNGYVGCKATFNNCIINNFLCLYDDCVFNNCVFNVSGDNYNVWTWSAPTVTFNGCTFNSDGKAVMLYGGANTVLTVNDCVFNDKGGLADLKAAIEVGNDYGVSYELIVNNTVVNGYEINDKGIVTGTTLWANKNSMGQDKLNVIVDGVDVY